MNFFESQETAKRNTGKLIFLFVLAVLSLIIITNVLVMFLFGFKGSEMTSMVVTNSIEFEWETFLAVGVAVSGIVLIGSFYKISSLSGGGARVAEMMNGRLLVSGGRDIHEQRALNVVEEMAIASGTPVPPVYLMEEAGINAFAAGYSPSDAVIGLTRGAIETLNRNQLQGVVAHEFSHIFHGDMRINIRLIGILHGIMVLGIIGYHLLRGSVYRRRSKDSGGIVALGLGLVVIGSVGTFFGNLIKAAVSRQREFLADASAVQFTRNPEGIAGALMQIGNHTEKSFLNNPASSEISHALFEEPHSSSFGGLYATHPSLESRIAAIIPKWDGSYELLKTQEKQYSIAACTDEAAAKNTNSSGDSDKRQALLQTILTGSAGVLVTDSIINQVGNPDERHVAYADALLASIPQVLLDAAREPSAARAVVYLLILDLSADDRAQQLDHLKNSADAGVYEELARLIREVTNVEAEHRLALVEIAISSLRQLSQNQYYLFKENFHALITMDKKMNLLEWALQNIVFHHLDAVFDKNQSSRPGKKEISQLETACEVLLSILAHSNEQNGLSVAEVFGLGASKLSTSLKLVPINEIDFEKLNAAVIDLQMLKPLQKPALLTACASCITADKEIVPIEAELFRAIAACIDCPMPPLIV